MVTVLDDRAQNAMVAVVNGIFFHELSWSSDLISIPLIANDDGLVDSVGSNSETLQNKNHYYSCACFTHRLKTSRKLNFYPVSAEGKALLIHKHSVLVNCVKKCIP